MATLIRILGDFDAAEEAVQDAFAVALERWPADGIPDNPGAWITRVARNKAIDRLRRERTLAEKRTILEGLERLRPEEDPDATASSGAPPPVAGPVDPEADDRLRLIFTCCHPALAPEARVALTLRTLGGLTTGEIARAFLASESAMAQRLVRAKRKIKAARIPYEVPDTERMPERLSGVLATLYLIFNEGYLASGADSLTRGELCADAIRLTRVLVSTMPEEPEAAGLLALMLFQDSRREARVDEQGALVRLAEQDRGLWDRDQIAEATQLIEGVLARGVIGAYGLQAAIASVHARAESPDATDWPRIVELYGRLAAIDDSPVIALNLAVAIGMAESPAAGLSALDAIEGLEGYHLLHAARADLLRRLERHDEAVSAYDRAIALTSNPVERSFLEQRRRELGQPTAPVADSGRAPAARPRRSPP